MINKYISILLAASLPLSAFAQKPIKITGVVTEGKVDSFGVVNLTQATLVQPEITYIKPDAKGSFVINLPTQTAFNHIALVHNNDFATVLASPKEKLDLKVNFTQRPKITIVSNKENSSAVAYQQFEQQKGGFQGVFEQSKIAYNAAPNLVVGFLDSLKKVDMATLPANADPAYVSFFKDQLDLYYHNALLLYGVTKIQSLGQNVTQEDVQQYANISLQTPKAVKESSIYYPVYPDYLVNYALYQYVYRNLQSASDANTNITQAVKNLDALSEKKSAAIGIAKLLQMSAKGLEPSVWSYLANEFVTKYPKDPNALMIKGMLDDIQKFDPGKKAIDFEFVTLEGEKKKLSDYKGKVVYLDFWASWCGPCRQQMPFAKEVKKHFEGKDVVFLYVSIDDTHEKWLKGIESMKVEGVQTRSGGWGGDLPKKYSISSIPAYFLIDKQGNFATRPPRPSQKQELIQVIEDLLKK